MPPAKGQGESAQYLSEYDSTFNCERSVMATCLVNPASLAGDDVPRMPSICDAEHLLEMKCLQVV